MTMVMPKRMQAMKLRDELQRIGVDRDIVDLEALTDSTLSYPENYRNIMSRYKRTDPKARKSKATYIGGGSGLDLSYAAQAHQARSPQARVVDERVLARRAYTEKQIARKPSKLDSWFKNPGRFDILGIDAFGFSRPAKKSKEIT